MPKYHYYTVDYYMPEGISWLDVGVHFQSYDEAYDYIQNIDDGHGFHKETSFRIKTHDVCTSLPINSRRHVNYIIRTRVTGFPDGPRVGFRSFHNDLDGARKSLARCRKNDPHSEFYIYDTFNEVALED